MSRVEIASMPWGTLQDRGGNAQAGKSATLKNLDGTNATTWSAVTGGSSSTASLTSDANGNLPRFVEGGQYTLDVPALSVSGRRVEAVSGSVESDVDSLEVGTWPVRRMTAGASAATIQAALDAASTAGGGIVYLPTGTYTLSTSLVMSHRARLLGEGYTTILIAPAGLPAIDCQGQGIEIGCLRIKGQSADSRPAAASHGILIDASNNVSSGFYEHFRLHDLHFQYLKGYAIKGLHGFRESWLERIIAKACGDTSVPALWFESFTGDSDQINYLKLDKIEVIFPHGHGIQFKSSQGSAARVGCYGNSLKNIIIHGGDEADANILPIAGVYGLVLNGASDTTAIDVHVTNIEKTSYCVLVTSTVDNGAGGIYKSLTNRLRALTLGGVVGLAAAADPTQTGGIGAYVDYADEADIEINSRGLTKDYELTANSANCSLEFGKAGSQTTTGTNAGSANRSGPTRRLPVVMNGNRLTTVGTAGTSAAIGFGILGASNQPGLYFSDPTPEGAVSAGIGSTYHRRQGGYSNMLYGKASGTGNTGWAPFAQRAMQTVATDAAFTLTPGTTPEETRHTGTLTANRAVTLSTTGAFAGERFKITRTGSGAFTLDIGTGPLKSLATNTWCEVTYDGSAWYLSAYGAL